MNFNLVSFLRRHAGIVCGFSAMFLAANTVAAKKTVNVLPVADSVAVKSASVSAADEDSVYLSADVMPEFPGGMGAFMKYLSEHIVYPKAALQKKIEGRVLVSFVIEKDGHVSNATVVKSVHPLLDAEALRVVGALSQWRPAINKGKPVRMKYSTPIAFRMSKPNVEKRPAR